MARAIQHRPPTMPATRTRVVSVTSRKCATTMADMSEMPPSATHRTPTAVVTGASSGIGAATARMLAGAGYHVYCAARRTDRISGLADEIGGTAVTCDGTDADSVARLAAAGGGTPHGLGDKARRRPSAPPGPPP